MKYKGENLIFGDLLKEYDIKSIISSFLRLYSTKIFEKLIPLTPLTDLHIIESTFESLNKKRLDEVPFETYIWIFIPKVPFDEITKTVSSLTLFIEKLNFYILTVIYFTIKKEFEKPSYALWI